MRPHGRAIVDSSNPSAFGTCDRCRMLYNLRDLKWQFDWGGLQLINQNLLVCDTCLDDPTPAYRTLIIPADPPPIYNARPEPYTVDETDWLTTQDGDTITTQSDTDFITSIPNPDTDANTANLIASISYPGGTTTGTYLDLFNGNPSSGGVSILSTIRGTSTRISLTTTMATINGKSVNPEIIDLGTALADANINYAGIYSAASGGTLLASGQCGASWPTIVAGAAVQFPELALSITL